MVNLQTEWVHGQIGEWIMLRRKKKAPAAPEENGAASAANAPGEETGAGTAGVGKDDGVVDISAYTPGIRASVFTLSEGMKVFEDAAVVRVISSDYNILILKDYMPLLGKVEGRVQIAGAGGSAEYENIRGYYMFRKNEFELLIDEDMYVK